MLERDRRLEKLYYITIATSHACYISHQAPPPPRHPYFTKQKLRNPPVVYRRETRGVGYQWPHRLVSHSHPPVYICVQFHSILLAVLNVIRETVKILITIKHTYALNILEILITVEAQLKTTSLSRQPN